MASREPISFPKSKKPRKQSARWASLPGDVFYIILNKLIRISDFIRVGAVCKRWRSVVLNHKRHRSVPDHDRVPMLLVDHTGGDHGNNRSLFDVLKKKTSKNFQVELPEHLSCCGSSYGWLVLLVKPKTLVLYNPFSRKTIQLPKLRGKRSNQFQIKKVILSANPSTNPDDYKVVAIYDNQPLLAIYNCVGKNWTSISMTRVEVEEITGFIDVAYCKGKLYGIVDSRRLVSINDNSSSTSETSPVKFVTENSVNYVIHETYLVESCQGNPLLVLRYLLEYYSSETRFEIYKLQNRHCKKKLARWIRVKTLGDQTLFLGKNYSVAVRASDTPGCHANSVYYTREFRDISGEIDGQESTGEEDVYRVLDYKDDRRVMHPYERFNIKKKVGFWNTNPCYLQWINPTIHNKCD